MACLSDIERTACGTQAVFDEAPSLLQTWRCPRSTTDARHARDPKPDKRCIMLVLAALPKRWMGMVMLVLRVSDARWIASHGGSRLACFLAWNV